MTTQTKGTTMRYATIDAGSVEYSRSEAAVDIDEFIAALEEARWRGATHIVGLSGNYRGAKYVSLSLPEMDEEED